MPENGQTQPGSVSLKKLTIVSVKGERIHLDNIKAELNIIEDLANPYVHGNVVLDDAENLIAELPITGQEDLEVMYHMPGEPDTKIEKTFRVYKISDLMTGDTNKSRKYILHFTGKEAFKSQQKSIQQGFVGRTISDIVQIIYDSHIKVDKEIEIEATAGVQNLIIPNLSPGETLGWLASRAYSAEHPSSNYMFWEDHDKFNFKTIDKHIAEGKKQTYKYAPQNAQDDKEKIDTGKTYIVEKFRIEKSIDTLGNINGGMYQSGLLTHDIVRKTYKKYEFDYEKDFADTVRRSKHLMPTPMHQTQDEFITGASTEYLIPTSYRRGELSDYAATDVFTKSAMIETFLQKRDSTYARFNNFVASVEIPGDSERMPGDVIEIELPDPSGVAVEDPKYATDKYYTGKFLVTQVRHKITGNVMTTDMQVIKESLNEEIK